MWKPLSGLLGAVLLSVPICAPAGALTLGDELPRSWKPILAEASSDFDSAVESGDTGCRPTPGRVAICSDAYGHGWLAIAQVWSARGRVVQAIVKLNETYFALARFNTPEWKTVVLKEALSHALVPTTGSDASAMPPAMTAIDFEGPAQWGSLVEGNPAGRRSTYRLDFGNGNTVMTYVTWVPTEDEGGSR